MVTVDGTDCKIQDPSPFQTKWYSHKHNGLGLHCELAVSVSLGHIGWANGPYPCGSFSDVKIYRQDLKEMLDGPEKV